MAQPHAWPWRLFNIALRLAGLFTALGAAAGLAWSILLIVHSSVVAGAQGALADPSLAGLLLFASAWFLILGLGILRAPAYRPDLGDADYLIDPVGHKLRQVFAPSRTWWTGDRVVGLRGTDQGSRSGVRSLPGHQPRRFDPAARLKRGVILTVSTLGTASLLYRGYLYLDYGARMPHAPEQETGRVHPFVFKNSRVYVTEVDQARFRAVTWMVLGSFVGFGLCLAWSRWSRRRAA
jgi:hypothetical protein